MAVITQGQRVRLPVAKGHPALWVRLARPLPYPPDQIRSVTLLTRVVADAVADGLVSRSRGGESKPEAGAVAAGEPLAEWEQELLAGQEAAPAETAAPAAEPAGEAAAAEAPQA